MNKNRIRVLLFVLCSFTVFLCSCTADNTNNKIDPKYAQIRFGATKDILLLDIEWHTEESYREEHEEAIIAEHGELPESHFEFIEDIKNGDVYVAKTINGKKPDEIKLWLTFDNPHNNVDKDDTSLIDPDGFFIYHIYPFHYRVNYYDDNGEYHSKTFTDENDLPIYSEKEFNVIVNDIISYCDELLAEGKIKQEEYDRFTIKSPLDYYVRVLGLFGEDDLQEYLPAEIPSIPNQNLIVDKDNYSILYIGNSFIFSGDVPKQVEALSDMYGISIRYDNVVEGGAALNVLMNEAIEKIQNNKYDYVVIQDYGLRPMIDIENFLTDVEKLCDEATKNGAVPVLYNPAWVSIDEKPDKEQQAIYTNAYERAAKANKATLVNAGEAWIYAYDKLPNISLYDEDGYHANYAGAYLTACVFVSTLFDLHVKDITENNLYHGDDAIALGQAAWEYVSYYKENKISPTE